MTSECLKFLIIKMLLDQLRPVEFKSAEKMIGFKLEDRLNSNIRWVNFYEIEVRIIGSYPPPRCWCAYLNMIDALFCL